MGLLIPRCRLEKLLQSFHGHTRPETRGLCFTATMALPPRGISAAVAGYRTKACADTDGGCVTHGFLEAWGFSLQVSRSAAASDCLLSQPRQDMVKKH